MHFNIILYMPCNVCASVNVCLKNVNFILELMKQVLEAFGFRIQGIKAKN